MTGTGFEPGFVLAAGFAGSAGFLYSSCRSTRVVLPGSTFTLRSTCAMICGRNAVTVTSPSSPERP